MILLATGHSDIGKRANNEDAYLVTEELFLVADGLGGHAHGEVASQMAVAAIEDVVRELSEEHPALALREGVYLADHFIRKKAYRSAEHEGMGTTIVGLLIREGRAAIVHAGDSRCYRMRDGKLEQLTVDHACPGSHMIHRSLGNGKPEQGEVRGEDVAIGDVFLLCSDGLYTLPAWAIENVLKNGGEAHDLVGLVLACQDSHQDNVTAVVVRVVE